MPYPQAVQADHNLPAAMDLLVKTNADIAQVAGQIREMARDVSPNLLVGTVASLQDVVAGSTSDFRSTILVFLSFAAAALILAAAGIYGLVSNSVTQRTYEIGVRVAIGASRAEILRLILGQSLRLTLVGVAAGIIGALALTRFLVTMLFAGDIHRSVDLYRRCVACCWAWPLQPVSSRPGVPQIWILSILAGGIELAYLRSSSRAFSRS